MGVGIQVIDVESEFNVVAGFGSDVEDAGALEAAESEAAESDAAESDAPVVPEGAWFNAMYP